MVKATGTELTAEQKAAVVDYVTKAKNRSERERQADVIANRKIADLLVEQVLVGNDQQFPAYQPDTGGAHADDLDRAGISAPADHFPHLERPVEED